MKTGHLAQLTDPLDDLESRVADLLARTEGRDLD